MERKELTDKLLDAVKEKGEITNSVIWAKENGIPHDNTLVGIIKSCESNYIIKVNSTPVEEMALTLSGQTALSDGSPECLILQSVCNSKCASLKECECTISLKELKKSKWESGFSEAMKNKWITLTKTETDSIVKIANVPTEDTTQQLLRKVQQRETIDQKELSILQKRKLIAKSQYVYYHIVKDFNFERREKPETELTEEMLRTNSWEQKVFKPLNANALGTPTSGGYRHPLAKIRNEFRQIFLEMGFEEMPTDKYIESSFWNFDALFQPQQHPARDMHDTFFVADPKYAQSTDTEADYLTRVADVHEHGGFGSIGYRYDWKEEESRKNIFRTHTTAVTTRMLYNLSKEGFRPCKCFSIDRVFRNETIDLTHLAEFHQVEGFIADYNIGLPLLISILSEFFHKLGMTNLRFKPAYNPYTEPSMEIFCYHPLLKKEIEIGNSGVFRPEMLRPMGLPENVSVIAWGLSLERPTMIKYGIKTIRTLFGPSLSIDFVKQSPICLITAANEENKE